MRHIHIVEPYHSPAMQRLAAPLMELQRIYIVTRGDEPDEKADLNIHVPFHSLVGYNKGGRHIAMYTHANPGSFHEVADACNRANIVTAMTFEGRKDLLNLGVEPQKIWVTYSAADYFPIRRRRILVVGIVQPNGRKRESLLLDLAWRYDLSMYEFYFTGQTWSDVVAKLQACGVAAHIVNIGDDNELKNLYYNCDLLLITGYIEGGSLPILEGMACGIPILSPRFGYAADLLDDEDLYTDAADLMKKIADKNEKVLRYHQLARAWDWGDYVREYALLIGRMFSESVDLFPEFATSRYAQLLDVIDEMQPQTICEVGTWSGKNAVRMLQQAGKYHPMKRIRYQGFDLFESQTGEQFTRELSKVGWEQVVVEKRLQATGANIELIQGDTYDTINLLQPADLYFIDGGHSEFTIYNDGQKVVEWIEQLGCVAVFDDYYHSGKPQGVGCNKFIDSLDISRFEITHLPARTLTDDGREIGMVKVCRHIYTDATTVTAKR